METLLVVHEVNDVDHCLASPNRDDFFGPLGIATRQSTATLQTITQQALAATSERFSAIQQLVNAIGGARDAKAVMDLQARIGAEQGMLQNDQTKLQVLYQAAQAQQWALQQRTREQAVTDIGSLRQLPAMGL